MKKILSIILSSLSKIWRRRKPQKNQPFPMVFRAKDRKKVKERSIKQLAQELKLKMTVQLLKPMYEFLPVTYRNVPGKTYARNKAFAYNIRHAIKGEYPNFKIDHEAVKVSRGNLYNSTSTDSYFSGGKIHFTWNSLPINNAMNDDVAVLVAYCPARQECIYTMCGPKRFEENAVLDVQKFNNHIVHAYLSFISANGNLVADSKYMGRFTIK